MKHSKSNPIIANLIRMTVEPVITQAMTVEEAVCNAVYRPANNEHGRELQEIITLVKANTHYSTGEIENALSDLQKEDILKAWQPSGTMRTTRPTYYQPTFEFLQLLAEKLKHKPSALFEISIKVKGNDVTLQDLHFFYKNVNWLLKTQPGLEYIWVGSSRLTREEAAALMTNLVEKHPFGE